MNSRRSAKEVARDRRHKHVRRLVKGTSERPRLNVYRSLSNIYVQIIDDSRGNTLVAASSLDGEVKEEIKGQTKSAQAAVVGKLIAEKAKKAGIQQVVFDRGGYKYHGRVKSLAEASREAGLIF